MIRLLAGPVCNFSAKVRLALAEKGISAEIEEVPYNLASGYTPKHPAVLAVNPQGSVPVLLLENAAIYDSTVILEYLEDRFPVPALYPGTAAERARCRQLEAEADEILWPSVRAFKRASGDGNALAAAAARRELEQFYRRFEDRLRCRDYCCNEFSVADIATWVFVYTASVLSAGPPSTLANVRGWYDRICTRPAFVQLMVERRAVLQRLEASRARAEAVL